MKAADKFIRTVLVVFSLILLSKCGKVCRESDNDPCYCDLKNGSGVLKLGTYAARTGDPLGPQYYYGTPSYFGDHGGMFYYNPCVPFTYTFGYLNDTFDITGLAMAHDMDPYDDNIHDIGQQASIVYHIAKNKELQIIYTSKDNKYRTVVRLECSPNPNEAYLENVEPVGYDDNTFVFRWYGMGVCPVPGPHLLHNENEHFRTHVIVSTVCGIVVLYVVIGFTYKLCKVRSIVPTYSRRN